MISNESWYPPPVPVLAVLLIAAFGIWALSCAHAPRWPNACLLIERDRAEVREHMLTAPAEADRRRYADVLDRIEGRATIAECRR